MPVDARTDNASSLPLGAPAESAEAAPPLPTATRLGVGNTPHGADATRGARERDQHHRLVASAINGALLVGFIIIAGLTPSAAKDALAVLPPLTTGFVRFGLASLLLLLTYGLRRVFGGASEAPINRRDYGALLLAALLCVPINQACYLTGVAWSSPSHAGLFYALNPVLVYLMTLALGRVRWSKRLAFAAVLAFAGAGAIGWESFAHGQGKLMFQGDLLLFCAVVTWAAYTIVVTPLSVRYGALRTVTIVMTLGSIMYAPAVLVDGQAFHLASAGPRALAGLAFITVLTSYLNYILWSVVLTRIDINRIAVSVNTAPIVAVVAAYFWHGDPITRWLALGAGLILLAITLANWDKLRALRRSRVAG